MAVVVPSGRVVVPSGRVVEHCGWALWLEAAVPCLGIFFDLFLFFLDSSIKELGEGAARFMSNLYWW